MAKGFDFIGLVVEAPVEDRANMLTQMAAMSPQSVEELQTLLAARLESTVKQRKAAAAKKVREERNAKIEALMVRVEACIGDYHTLAQLREEVIALDGVITLSGFNSVDQPLFSVSGLKVSSGKGGTGGGKPAANQPRPWVTPEGNRILGQLPKWAEANVGLDTLGDLASEHEIELSYSDKTGALGSKNLAKLLLKAELIVKSAVTSDETAAFEASKTD